MSKKILLVEDNEAISGVIETILEEYYEILVTRGYQDSVGILEVEDPAVAIIDLYLANNDRGTAILAWIRQKKKSNMPVILISGEHKILQDIRESGQYDFAAYLEKPLDYKEFIATVKELAG